MENATYVFLFAIFSLIGAFFGGLFGLLIGFIVCFLVCGTYAVFSGKYN